MAAKASGAGLINLTARICIGGGPCSVVVYDIIVYRELGDLTATFSRSLAPAVGVAIARVLAGCTTNFALPLTPRAVVRIIAGWTRRPSRNA